MLSLQRGFVLAAEAPEHGWQRLVVELEVAGERPAHADTGLVGASEPGDEVVVNTSAVDLGLGSGGFDLVHVNLTRGLGGAGVPGAHVMKENYTSLQHAVVPVEGPELTVPLARPAAVFPLHAHLPLVAWALGEAAPGARLGYVQTAGGALPGAMSQTVADLRERGLLAGHLTAGPAYGGEGEAITTPGAIHHGLAELGWDAAVCGPGPGILGSASTLGHGGMVALDTLHAALALGARPLLVARMSDADPRSRHRGLSHHAAIVLDLLLRPVTVAHPPEGRPLREDAHRWLAGAADLDGYLASGLPSRTMGRGAREDPAFFRAGLAAGSVLADMVRAS